MQLTTARFNDHIWYLDNGLLGSPGFGSTYVVCGDEIAIVETGPTTSAQHVLDGLRRLGIDPAAVRHIVLTHIHMDHAGGTGTLLPHMPEATVHIHSRTAKFLIDPTELIASAQRALGDLFPLHGDPEPVPAERIAHMDDQRLDLGCGVVLEAIASPGHSPDHLAYYERSSRSLFSGDSLGIMIPLGDYAGPVTPPPAYNHEAQRATFDKLGALPIDAILFSHFGPHTQNPHGVIAEQHERYERLFELVQRQWQDGRVDMDAITDALVDHPIDDPQRRSILVGWIEMSVRGLVVMFDRQAKKAQQAAS